MTVVRGVLEVPVAVLINLTLVLDFEDVCNSDRCDELI